ncbi:uncharacterized protein B0H18DRAFT_1009902, partial [Fomitopsis serialis]|uniref:uncharacterized protein n=1 Tax=Fomitopsis serialis TaxID=139415 RepID=UPI0020071EA7
FLYASSAASYPGHRPTPPEIALEPSPQHVTASVPADPSPVPPNLWVGEHIQTAAALIIGDEILNGKTLDRNSNYFARFCFENGIDLKRIEVYRMTRTTCAVEASRRLVKTYDFVITSGGIGPTHDDPSRMTSMSRHRADIMNQTAEQREARERMALFPAGAEALFIAPDVWVPTVRLEGKLCRMIDGLKPYLPLPPLSERPFRLNIHDSSIAPYLTELQARTKAAGVRVGSYPLLMRGVYVALIGRDEAAVKVLATEVAE